MTPPPKNKNGMLYTEPRAKEVGFTVYMNPFLGAVSLKPESLAPGLPKAAWRRRRLG